MTNEEKKSNEIAAEYLMGHDRLEVTYEEMREAVMEMAQWKDQQFKEYLEKKRGIFLSRAVELYDSTDTMASAYNNARLKLLDEIINELFKED